MTTISRRLLLAFALLGLGAASYSLYVHYQLTHQSGYVAACDINAVFSCTNAYLSRFGNVAGIPTALFGVLWFAFVLLFIGVGGRPGSPFADSVGAYLFAASTLGLAAIFYLGYAAFFILKAVCIACMFTWAAVIGLFVVSGVSTAIPMTKLPRRAFQDLKSLASRPALLAAFVLFLAAAGGAIALFPPVVSGAPAPAAPSGPQQVDFVSWFDAQPRLNIPVPTDGAKVLIAKFTDFQCPACGQTHLAEKPVIARLHSEFPGQIKYVIKHYPLEKECNPMSGDIHIAACEAAAAIVMARALGRDEALGDWFVNNQQFLSPAVVKEAARTTGLVKDFEAQYARALEVVKTDTGLGRLLGVRQTPTYFINGVKIEGALPPQLFEAAIRHELSKAGAAK